MWGCVLGCVARGYVCTLVRVCMCMCVCEHASVSGWLPGWQSQGGQAGRGHGKQGVDRAGLSRGPRWGHSAELGGREGRRRWSRAPSPYLVSDASGEHWVAVAMVLGSLVGPRADWGRGPGLQRGWGWEGRGAQCLGQRGLRPHTHGHSITRPQPPGAGRSPGPSEKPTEPPRGGRAAGHATHQGPLPPSRRAQENPGHSGKLTPRSESGGHCTHGAKGQVTARACTVPAAALLGRVSGWPSGSVPVTKPEPSCPSVTRGQRRQERRCWPEGGPTRPPRRSRSRWAQSSGGQRGRPRPPPSVARP